MSRALMKVGLIHLRNDLYKASYHVIIDPYKPFSYYNGLKPVVHWSLDQQTIDKKIEQFSLHG